MKKEDLRIVFMGTPEFAKKSLEELLENKYNVVGVFCQPDRPSGRGMKLTKPPVKVLAEENGISVYQPEKIKNNEEVLTANNIGVDAKNLHATTYLIIGSNSRFEDYGSRTGCFWIGG